MKIAEWSVNRPVTTLMIYVTIVVLGLVSIPQLGLDLMPDIEIPAVSVLTSYDGAGPEEIETLITKPIEDAVTCYIPGDTLVELVKSNGNFSIELMQLTCRELGEANTYITDIAQKTVRERLAEILIHLKNDFGLDENNILQISLTREELANIVGTATESVIRLLSEFKQDGLINLNGRKITILNESSLIRIGNLYD